MKNENYEDRAQAQLASIKRDMRKTLEDATVRAMHKVMAEFEAKSDERLMEDWGPGPHEYHSLLVREPEQPAQQQEPVDLEAVYEIIIQWDEGGGKRSRRELARRIVALYTSPPPQRKPLTHEQRVDLLAKFEPHKHEWHAPAILIDMVEAAHNIKETP